MAQKTEGAATGAATSAGSSAAMGQIRMGNVSMNKEDIEMQLKAGWSRQTEAVDWDSTRVGGGKELGFYEKHWGSKDRPTQLFPQSQYFAKMSKSSATEYASSSVVSHN